MNNNVVSIFEAFARKQQANIKVEDELQAFEVIQKQNVEKNERLQKERDKANEAVLKSYKLKEKDIGKK